MVNNLSAYELDIFFYTNPETINSIDVYGESMLHKATRAHNIDTITVCIKHGFDINARSGTNGMTPLFYAVREGLHDIVVLLLTHGADPDIPDNTSDYCILWAFYKYNLDMVSALIELGGCDTSVTYNNFDWKHWIEFNPYRAIVIEYTKELHTEGIRSSEAMFPICQKFASMNTPYGEINLCKVIKGFYM